MGMSSSSQKDAVHDSSPAAPALEAKLTTLHPSDAEMAQKAPLPQATLLGLPRELRDSIMAFVFAATPLETQRWSSPAELYHTVPTNIPAVCQALRAESEKAYASALRAFWGIDVYSRRTAPLEDTDIKEGPFLGDEIHRFAVTLLPSRTNNSSSSNHAAAADVSQCGPVAIPWVFFELMDSSKNRNSPNTARHLNITVMRATEHRAQYRGRTLGRFTEDLKFHVPGGLKYAFTSVPHYRDLFRRDIANLAAQALVALRRMPCSASARDKRGKAARKLRLEVLERLLRWACHGDADGAKKWLECFAERGF
ncbi:hypothetical protein LTR85_005629 [Meristemomyces frigidus]|nr:hypothetical protein LTR85_005629 [Meristemomyces frigidus]